MNAEIILQTNKKYWRTNADEWFGVTALPKYGVHFVTESELWGLDISKKQLENARAYLTENHYAPKLICSPMEDDCDIPTSYFDEEWYSLVVHDTEMILGKFPHLLMHWQMQAL